MPDITTKEILTSVSDWLKFAEAKNGTLLVFDSGISIAILSIINSINSASTSTAPRDAPDLLYILLFIFGTGAVLSLLSFFPILSNNTKIFKCKKTPNQNPLFFGHIASLSDNEYKQILIGINIIDKNASPAEDHIINQIIINSKIAANKFEFFKVAIYAHLVVPVIAYAIILIFNKGA